MRPLQEEDLIAAILGLIYLILYSKMTEMSLYLFDYQTLSLVKMGKVGERM